MYMMTSICRHDVFLFSGWYIVWKVFLCRFKFVRELMGTSSDGSLSGAAGETNDRTAVSNTRGPRGKPRLD